MISYWGILIDNMLLLGTEYEGAESLTTPNVLSYTYQLDLSAFWDKMWMSMSSNVYAQLSPEDVPYEDLFVEAKALR